MKRAPNIDDYGGNRYGSRYRNKHGSSSMSSHVCDECGTRRFISKRELSRAASPRCLKCGGVLVETKSEEKRHQNERESVTTNVYRCRNCGSNLGRFTPHSLLTHFTLDGDECVEYYIDEEYTFFFDRKEFILGTAFVEKHSGEKHTVFPWKITAFSVEHRCVVTVCLCKRQRDARQLIAKCGRQQDLSEIIID